MPRVDGFEVLEWIRSQPVFGALRVVVLTSSDSLRDVNRAYQLGANSFLVKPADLQQFAALIQALHGYWIWTNEVPEGTEPLTEEKPRRV
jgi:CheY-like chemotaxis protein